MAQQKKKNASGEEPDTGEIKRDALHGPMKSLDAKPIKMQRLLCLGAVIWAITTLFLWRRFRLTFEMSEDQQPLTLFSENAMYYSYYLDVIRAPSSLQAIATLMRDQRSEHPTTINALERFNIYPALALREHWGLPFLWLNMIALFVMLQRHMKKNQQAKVAALFGVCLLGYPLSIVIRRIVSFYLLSFASVFLLMFAPNYLAFSFFPHVAVSVLFSLWCLSRLSASPRNFLFWLLAVDFRRGAVAVGVCGLIRCALIPFEKDDAHVFRILLHHLGLSESTFDSSIYMLGHTEFLPLNANLASHIKSSGVLFFSCPIAVIVMIFLGREIFLLHRLTCKNWKVFLQFDEGLEGFRGDEKQNAVVPEETKSDERLSEEHRKLEALIGENLRLRKPAKTAKPSTEVENVFEDNKKQTPDEQFIAALVVVVVFIRLQTLCFTALMLLIARLRVLALPLLCLFASLIVSADFWRASIERLLSAVSSKNIPPGSGVMGDMTTSAFLRAALPSIRIVVHPQYENVVIRKRVQLTYGGAACPSMPLYNQQLRDVYKVDFLIQNSFRCAVPPKGRTSVFDVADKIDAFNFKCPAGTAREQRFCFRTLFDNNRFFSLVYANEEFSILQRLDEPMVDQLATETPTATSQEYLSFNWKEKIMQKSSWEPWIRRCKIDPETTEQYALFLDFNLHSPAAAEKYYRMAASTQSPSLGRAVQYALYLQENSKDDDLYIQALDGVANTASLLSLPRSELLEETDNICRGAVLLQHIAGDSRYEISAAKRTRFSESAHILWHKAREINIQSSCVVRHWQLFEGTKLRTFRQIVHFLVGDISGGLKA
ncbi:uncharacterized protein LOC34619379 [Cyclospora cayetanensis]|uniref:Uncharacterized protein LOC34619379 n=1 Tax=Cyclospora cayetanensis TaxID=88456 RepID=A0A6P6RWB4_9EIME|nr:uncharacterized protein LOC34619379 [Cyclospora cayetanensis]